MHADLDRLGVALPDSGRAFLGGVGSAGWSTRVADSGRPELRLRTARSARVPGFLGADQRTTFALVYPPPTPGPEPYAAAIATTDPEGRFTVDGLSGGTYTLAVVAERCRPAAVAVTVPAGTRIERNVGLVDVSLYGLRIGT